jgi:hypothetical protein
VDCFEDRSGLPLQNSELFTSEHGITSQNILFVLLYVAFDVTLLFACLVCSTQKCLKCV